MHVYAHVPFCRRRCSYCDFAIAVRKDVPSQVYVDLVLREWNSWQADAAWQASPRVQSVYLGGGTPSKLTPGSIARLLEGIGAVRAVAPDGEITLEANPEDVTSVAAAGWRSAGVNRVSLGVQSFDARALHWMHRTHSADQVHCAVEALRYAGINDISLDLIFGIPSAVQRDWPRDLDLALALSPHHLSLYGLTMEPRTPLARWMDRGEVAPASDDRYAVEFLLAHQILVASGYEHYEVSNAARPGHRARHNSSYWRREPFIGLGPAAHSGFGSERRWNVREWAEYERLVAAGKSPMGGCEQLDATAIELEELYLGLRTIEGLSVARVPGRIRHEWGRAGWAETDGDRIWLTPEGWLRLDALVASLSRESGVGSRESSAGKKPDSHCKPRSGEAVSNLG